MVRQGTVDKQGGRCRMKSRTDTTPVHSIITKPRNSHPPSALLAPPLLFLFLSLSLYALLLLAKHIHEHEWYNAMTNQRKQINNLPQPNVYPFPPTSLLLLFLSLSVVSRFSILVHWLRSIHRPSSGHIGGVLPTHCSGKCKMDVLRSDAARCDSVRKPDCRFLYVRRERIVRMSYNVTASSKSRISPFLDCELVIPSNHCLVSRVMNSTLWKWLWTHECLRFRRCNSSESRWKELRQCIILNDEANSHLKKIW